MCIVHLKISPVAVLLGENDAPHRPLSLSRLAAQAWNTLTLAAVAWRDLRAIVFCFSNQTQCRDLHSNRLFAIFVNMGRRASEWVDSLTWSSIELYFEYVMKRNTTRKKVPMKKLQDFPWLSIGLSVEILKGHLLVIKKETYDLLSIYPSLLHELRLYRRTASIKRLLINLHSMSMLDVVGLAYSHFLSNKRVELASHKQLGKEANTRGCTWNKSHDA
jgi:hypothetical protein